MTEAPAYRELLEEFLPDQSSPLYRLTAEYAFTAIERGFLIADIVERWMPVRGSKVLDIGCGEGGVAIAFALRGGDVTALDVAPARIERMNVWASEHGVAIGGIVADARKTSLPDGQYDIVICNDFMEHVSQPQALAYEVERLLKDGGCLYLSVQSRLSVFGFLSDPHLGLLGITLMPRWLARMYAEKMRRRTTYYSVFVIPTHGYLTRIFSNTRIRLTSVTTGDPGAKIANPHLINSSPKRKAMLAAQKLGLAKLAFRLLDSRFNQFFLDALTYVGKKNEET